MPAAGGRRLSAAAGCVLLLGCATPPARIAAPPHEFPAPGSVTSPAPASPDHPVPAPVPGSAAAPPPTPAAPAAGILESLDAETWQDLLELDPESIPDFDDAAPDPPDSP